jgi:hypothetical protein
VAAALATNAALMPRLVSGILVFKALLAFHAVVLLLLWQRTPGSAQVLESSAAASESPALDRNTFLLMSGLLAIATLVRGVSLDGGLWHDEISTLVRYASRPLGEVLSVYNSQNQHPLYSLLAHESMSLFGESAWALRLPAAAFGVASLAAAFWFATLITTRTEALLTSALLTASYHHVWFSQNARGYTMMLCMTLISTGLFLKMLRGQSGEGWRSAVLYAVVMALAIYTHLSAAFVVIAHAAIWTAVLLRSRGRVHTFDPRPAVALLLACTLSLQLYAIVLPQLFDTLFGPKPVAVETVWQNPLWLIAETARGLSRGVPGGWLGIAAGALVAGSGALSYARRSPIVLALMVTPPIVVAAIMLALRHNLWPRFFFFAAAFAVLIVVRGVYALAEKMLPQRGRALATAAVLAIVAGSALTVPRAWGPKQDFRGALAYVEQSRKPEDAVVVLGLSDLALLEYLRTNWDTPRTSAELRGIEGRHSRTWAVYTFPAHLAAFYPDIDERLRSYRTAAEFPGTLGGGTVYVMVNP